MTAPHAEPPSPVDARQAVALVALTLLCWAPALRGGFVWDDHSQVVAAPYQPSLGWALRALQVDVWTALETGSRTGYYRPGFVLSLGLDRWLWGLEPVGHHAQNLAWHAGAVAATATLARRLGGPAAGWITGILLALHPLGSEVVAWISGRSDAMVAAMGLASLLLLLDRPLRPARAAAAFLLALGALLTKELAVPLLTAFPLLEHARRRAVDADPPAPPGGHAPAAAAYGVLGAAALTWLALRGAADLSPLPGGPTALVELLPRVPELIGLYGSLLVLPWPLSTGRHLDHLVLAPSVVAAGWACLLLLTGWAGRAAPWVTAAALWMGGGAWTASLIGMAATRQVGERYAYLALVGGALAVGVAAGRRPRWTWLGAWAVAALLAVQLRIPQWRDELALTAADVRATPGPYAWHGHGAALCGRGQPAQAGPLLAAALEGSPPYLPACELRIRCAMQACRAADWTKGFGTRRRRGSICWPWSST